MFGSLVVVVPNHTIDRTESIVSHKGRHPREPINQRLTHGMPSMAESLWDSADALLELRFSCFLTFTLSVESNSY